MRHLERLPSRLQKDHDLRRAQIDTWEREYLDIHSIPSSTRLLPSKAVLLIEPLINFGQAKRILDAGCGNGRNAIHFAKKEYRVIAADFSPAALDLVSTQA